MNHHEVMTPFSDQWCIWNLSTMLSIAMLILIGKNTSKEFNSKLAIFLAILFGVEMIFIQFYYLLIDVWSITESLPFHLCRMMWFLSLFALVKRSQWAFEMLLYIGMVGGFHSLLTPELTHGIDQLMLFDYFLVHGGLIAVPLYCLFVFGMRPRKNAWIRSFLYLQIFVLIVSIINYLYDANYMYLMQKPMVSNPLLIGEWPTYILGLEIAALLHAFLVNLPFYRLKAYLK
jgi:hypothetical integral membrane protein (TIGR02206 family)